MNDDRVASKPAQLHSHLPPGRSIALMDQSTALTSRQLEERSLIHRNGEAKADVEAFRELRTKLLAMGNGNFVTLVAPVSRGRSEEHTYELQSLMRTSYADFCLKKTTNNSS